MLVLALPAIGQTPSLDSSYSGQFVKEYRAEIPDYDVCSCVSYAKYLMNVPQTERWGNANEIEPTSLEPEEKGLVLIGKSHIAYYERIGDTLYLQEANWTRCKLGIRQLNIDDPNIRGYK